MSETRSGSDGLHSWKDIAAYLECSVRSAQRWEATRGLPVQRIVTPDGGQIIYANRRTIDAWKARVGSGGAETHEPATNGSPSETVDGRSPGDAPPTSSNDTPAERGTLASTSTPEALTGAAPWKAPVDWRRHVRPVARTMLAALALVAGIGSGIWTVTSGLPTWQTPVRFIVDGGQLRALAGSERQVWAAPLGRFAQSPALLAPHQRFAVGDLDSDGRSEVAIPVSWAAPRTVPEVSEQTLLFDTRGHLKRTITPPTVEIRDGGRTFEGPWMVSAVAFSSPPRTRLWVAYMHHTSHPAFVLEVDAHGAQRIRYLHAGTIRALTHWQHGRQSFLAVGGMENQQRQAAVTVIDLDGAPARWPVESASVLSCTGCPIAPPRAVVSIPTSHVTYARLRSTAWVAGLSVTPAGSLSIDVSSGGSEVNLETSVVMSPALAVTSAERSSHHWAAHRALETEGMLNHAVDACPEAGGVDIWFWARDSWTTSRVADSRASGVTRVATGVAASSSGGRGR
jgi:hypothetical protein